MKRLALILLCALPASAVQIHAAPVQKPNILLILADDLGYLLTQAFAGARTLSIRRGHWKYLDHRGSGGNAYDKGELKPYALPEAAPDAPVQLCDLAADPGETTNLHSQKPEIVKELKSLLAQSKTTGRSRP